MQQRPTMLTTQAPQAQGPNPLLKLLQQQNGKGPDAHFQPNDLDMASAAALAQHFQGLQQRAPAQAFANNANAAAGNAAANQMAMLALMQSNPLLAQSLGLGGGVQANNHAAAAAAAQGANPAIMAAALAQAQQAQARANLQQAALATLLRQQGAAAGANTAANAAALQKLLAGQAQAAGLPGARGPAAAAAAAAAAQNAQLLALQRAAAAQVTQMMQQQQQQANNPAITQAQMLAALAAQQQKQAQQLQQAQHMQALKAVLERNNHQQPQLSAFGGGNQQGDAAAMLKQLQLHEAMAKQTALSRAAQQNNGNNPALELLLRQQQAAELAAQGGMPDAMVMAQKAAGLRAAIQNMQHMPAANGQNMQQQSALERAVQQQQQQQKAQAAANMHARLPNGANNGAGLGNPALDLLLAQQQQQNAHATGNKQPAAALHGMNGGGNGGVPNGAAGLEAVTGVAGLNGNANLNNKEQRRLALACVALQLARSGVSVEQAIQSGIMGGMSVVDVRFIVECYNAERARMAAGGGSSDSRASNQQQPSGSTGPADNMMGLQAGGRSAHTSRTHSPAASIAGSHMSLFSQPQANGGHGSSILNPNTLAVAGASSLSDQTHDVSTGRTAGVPGYGGQSPDHSSPRSAATRTSQEHTGATSLAPTALEDAAFTNFNAFNYGFFSSKDGDLLGELELEPDGEGSSALDATSGLEGLVPPEGVTEEQLAWLRSTADAHRARWEGAGEEGNAALDVWGKDDDLAARLANLDLGSGFM